MAGAGGIRAGAAFVEMWLNDHRLTRGLKRLSAKLKAFGASVTALGVRMMTLGAGLAAPLILAVRQFSKMGDTIHKMSARTGMSAKALSELGFAAERSGTNLGTLEKGLRRMQRNLVDAKRGLSTAVDGFAMLGLSAQQLEGMSPEDQFTLIAERIAQIEDPTKKAAVAQMIFGRAGAELIPLLNEGAAGMAKLRKKAQELGITMSQDDANAAAKLSDALGDVWSAAKAGVFHIGSALAGSLTEFAQRVSETVATVSKWVRENQGLVVSVAKMAGALLVGGAAVVAVGAVFSGLGAVVGGVVSVIGLIGVAFVKIAGLVAFLLSPIGLVIAGLTALATWFLTSTAAGGEALSWLGDRFRDLKADALASFGGIADALAAGDIGLAAKILWLTLKMEWQKGVHFLNGIWQECATFFSKVWTGATFNASKILVNATSAMSSGWVEAVGFMEDVWALFLNALQSGWRTSIGFIEKGWLKLKSLVTGEDTTAQQKDIDRKVAAGNKAGRDSMLSGIGDRDRDRRKKLAGIDAQRQGTLSELDDEQRRRNAARDRKHAASLAGTQRDVDAAKAEWQKALDRARQGRTTDATEPDALPTLAELQSKIGGGMGVAGRAAETRGTFSAFALRGMQSGGPAERTAKATESTAKNTRAIDEKLAESRGVLFTS